MKKITKQLTSKLNEAIKQVGGKTVAVVASVAMLGTMAVVSGTALALDTNGQDVSQNTVQTTQPQGTTDTADGAQTAGDQSNGDTADGTADTTNTTTGDTATTDQSDANADTTTANGADAAAGDTADDATGDAATTDKASDAASDKSAASVPALAADAELPGTVQTTNTNDKGVSVNLHDYDLDAINGSGRNFKFDNDGGYSTPSNPKYNGWTRKNGGVFQGIVSTDLGEDGYPLLSGTKTDGYTDSLAYLFNGQRSSGVSTNYSNVDGLFQMCDVSGDNCGSGSYYTYDSAKNFATYQSDNTFKLYQQGRFNGQLAQSDGAFMPFNDLNNSTSNYLKLNGSQDGNGNCQGDGCITGYDLTAASDYYFGMDISAKFYMPSGGQVNNEDMVFSFAGDDDVWVFIDGKLALDLGGIHDSYGGKINFATGAITYDDGALGSYADSNHTTNLRDILGTNWQKAGQTHELKFFYLERGAGGSNCKISFNLPTLPSDQIQIAKEVEGEANKDTEYSFTAYVNYDGEGNDYTPYSGAYDVYNESDTSKPVSNNTTTDGTFTLKAGQYAVLKGSDTNEAAKITSASKYYVVENVDTGAYSVSANNGNVNVAVDAANKTATTDKVTVADTPRTTVTNTVIAAPTHRKYIKDNKDGTYTLSLDVTGSKSESSETSSNKIDVVYVLDVSGSMDASNNSQRDDRLTKLKNAANNLTNTLFDANNHLDTRVGIVKFASPQGDSNYQNTAKVLDFTNQKNKVDSTINNLYAGGATDWAGGLQLANTYSPRSDAAKYVVFLTDGVPTTWTVFSTSVYNNAVAQGKKLAQAGWNIINIGIAPGQHYVNPNKDELANNDHGDSKSNRHNTDSVEGLTARENAAVSGSASYYAASDASKLDEIFAQIAQTITKSVSYKNVTITDTLSEWAEFPANFSEKDATVTAKDTNGNTVNIAGKYTVTYNAKTKQVTVKFSDGYELENGVTYTVSFKVKPTQAAYDKFATGGTYPNTGDPYTDAPGNATSSGKPGFNSNASASVEYTVVNQHGGSTQETTQTTPYDDPVLQVRTGKIDVTKNWNPESSAPMASDAKVTVNLYKGDSATGTPVKTIGITKGTDGLWKGSFSGLAPGTYFVQEADVDGYTASYSGQTVTISETDLWKADNSKSDANVKSYQVTITNTLKSVTVSNLGLVKKVSGADWTSPNGKNFSFTLTCKDSGDSGAGKCSNVETLTNNKATASTDGNIKDGQTQNVTFGALKFNAAGTYTFELSEDQSGRAAGWAYDDQKVTVTVEVKTNAKGVLEATVKYGGKETKPTFTNTYIAVSSLPLTGGSTGRDWLLAGGGFGVLALLACASYSIWRRRRLV